MGGGRGGENQLTDFDVLRLRRSDVALAIACRYRDPAPAANQVSASLRSRYLCGRGTLHPISLRAGDQRDFSSRGAHDDGVGRRFSIQRRRRSRFVVALVGLSGEVAVESASRVI